MTPAEQQMQREPGGWVSKYQASLLWRVSVRSIDNWIEAQKVATIKKPSGRVLVWVPEKLLTQGGVEVPA